MSSNLQPTYGYSNFATFTYAADGQRRKMVVGNTTTVYCDDYQVNKTGSTEQRLHYISGPAGLCALIVQNYNNGSLASRATYYLQTDYQGSIIAAYNSNGTLYKRFAYDPWGRRRAGDNWTNYQTSTETLITRGYCGHEHLDDFGTINMNGRIYDPRLGRFLSPDPYVQAPYNSQNYNRYSYCLNNPLKYTDPTGEIVVLAAVVFVIKAAIVGAAINGGIYAAKTAVTGQQWDWNQFGKAAAIGAIAGVASAGAGALSSAIMPSVYGAVPGALIKGGIQGVSGGISGGFGNVIMEGGWGDNGCNFWKGAGQGFATGFIMGGISGGIEGYKNAQSVGANLWSGELYQNQKVYSTTPKSGIPLQSDPSKHCYGHTCAYADAGHGNRSVADFVKKAEWADGADAGQVFKKVDKSAFNFSAKIKGSQWDNIGGRLVRGGEIMGTTSRDGMSHWVNITKIVTADKWKIVGGGWKRVLFSTSVWDPNIGHTSNGPTSFFSIVSLF